VRERRLDEDRRNGFDADYREDARLHDGTRVVLRLIGPGDRAALRRSFERLSPGSRYRRFFCRKPHLTDAELDYLVDVDGVDHLAIVALGDGGKWADEILGVARFVRLADRPTVAEPAVTVADEVQGSGLGTLLTSRLCAAARERGIERFACEYLVENRSIQSWLEKVAHTAVFERHGDVTRAEFAVPDIPPRGHPDRADRGRVTFRLLAGAARRGIEIRLQHLVMKDADRE
jgi:GNAT superfamily N-acetyltransferase